jgi:hypothetical protein
VIKLSARCSMQTYGDRESYLNEFNVWVLHSKFDGRSLDHGSVRTR